MVLQYTVHLGKSRPLGVSREGTFTNFALFAPTAKKVSLWLYTLDQKAEPLLKIELDPKKNRSENTWHIALEIPQHIQLYRFEVDSAHGLVDPYALGVYTTNQWGTPEYHPFGQLAVLDPFDWGNDRPPHIPMEDLILYEMHVRGFTQHSSSQVKHPGTFLGMIEKIPHLLDLGVNCVELLPIFEFYEMEYQRKNPVTQQRLCNYWGYSTVNFFSLMQRYASGDVPSSALTEFKMLVKELHKHGIEVILDVVYNHTAEGNEKGPVYSFKGLSKPNYYLLDKQGKYYNFSGCGNTFNCNNPIAIPLILDSLKYWVTETHVDGFRFDLASILTRGPSGAPLPNPPLLEAMAHDPILSKVKMIAEPWDAGGLYQLGQFCKYGCSEWNDRYRDRVRRFINSSGSKGEFSTALCGSQDIFQGYSPLNSINFVIAHDGFNLADLVSYNRKHNTGNGEDNRDGTNDNYSWNCGMEGPTTKKEVLRLRERQMRNFHLALMISQGVPMLQMGDEYGHTKKGNNNTWCQDNELNWFLWDKLEERQSFYRFYRKMISFRKDHPILRSNRFLTEKDVEWHGRELHQVLWEKPDNLLAFTLKDPHKGEDLFIAFNANHEATEIAFPEALNDKKWHWIVNTANPAPYDFREEHAVVPIVSNRYRMSAHSALILKLL